MYEFKTIEIDPSTSKTEAIKTVVNHTEGIIKRVRIKFPYGCINYVRCQIFLNELQIYPDNPDDYFHDDDDTIEFEDNREILDSDELWVKAWNISFVNTHTITVGINIIPKYLTEESHLQAILDTLTKSFRLIVGV